MNSDPAAIENSDLRKLLRLLRFCMVDTLKELRVDAHTCWLRFLQRFTGSKCVVVHPARGGLTSARIRCLDGMLLVLAFIVPALLAC